LLAGRSNHQAEDVEMGEPMRYKSIAATVGATALLAMGITAAEKLTI
jgi:hypothetical protein